MTLRGILYFGWRALRRQPGFTCVAVLTLAIGIGANTAVFSLLDALLWQRLPVRAPDELVLFSDSLFTGTVTGDPPAGRWDLFSSDMYDSLRSSHLPLASIAAVASGADAVTFRIPGRPESDSTPAARARVQLVSGNYFEVMGVDAAAGRTLTQTRRRARRRARRRCERSVLARQSRRRRAGHWTSRHAR